MPVRFYRRIGVGGRLFTWMRPWTAGPKRLFSCLVPKRDKRRVRSKSGSRGEFKTMFILHNYSAAVICCMVTMLCWGSWANTQKLAANTWRFELFYWDYVVGILLFSLALAFTFGSMGSGG